MKINRKYVFYILIALMTFSFGNGLVSAEECTNPNHSNGKHYTCIHFFDEYTNSDVRKSCAPEGTSGTKTYTHNVTQHSNLGNIYNLIGWFDADGNQVSSNATVRASYSASSEKCEDIYYYLKWEELKAPVLHFNYIDNVSTGTGSWSNENGGSANYTHTFSEPDPVDHFSFVDWKIEDSVYNPGDQFSYDFSNKPYNSNETIIAYAWWQSSVTLNLYDDNTLLKSTEDFVKVSIDGYKPSKDGYTFVGWKDEDGNMVTVDTFYPEAVSYLKVTPKVVNLYAVWSENKTDSKDTTKEVKTVKVSGYPNTITPPKTGI